MSRALVFTLALFAIIPPLAAAEPHMSTAQMSAAFQRFKYSFFQDPKSAQDALDTASLAALTGDERVQAETMLLAFLPDARAVIGLGVLRSKKAEPELKRLFAQELDDQAQAERDAQQRLEWNPLGLLYLARALWLIDPDPRWPAAAIHVLGCAHYEVQRQEAAEVLAVMPTPQTVVALTKALDDPDSMVRHHAARALLAAYGVPYNAMDPQDMTIRVMSDDAVRREGGKRDILAAIAGRTMVRQ